jgi:two-component system sensor histidine kinase SenX3
MRTLGHLTEATKMANWTPLGTYGDRETSEQPAPLDIVAGVLHELETPLAAILAAGENIRDGLFGDPDRLREEGRIIVAYARRLRNLGDQILLYASTGEQGVIRDIRALTAGEIIDNAVDSVSILLEQRGFTLEREIEMGLPLVRGDLQLLSQCLENLITNAVKYSGQSRWVKISAVLGECSVSGREEIHVSVGDRGWGISAEDLPYIFEPFYRSRRPPVSRIPGSGLGLSIARSCVEACGGTLSVASQEGGGCVFTLHLPSYGEVRAEDLAQCWPSGPVKWSDHLGISGLDSGIALTAPGRLRGDSSPVPSMAQPAARLEGDR